MYYYYCIQVNSFKFLGTCIISDGKYTTEISSRISQAESVFTQIPKYKGVINIYQCFKISIFVRKCGLNASLKCCSYVEC